VRPLEWWFKPSANSRKFSPSRSVLMGIVAKISDSWLVSRNGAEMSLAYACHQLCSVTAIHRLMVEIADLRLQRRLQAELVFDLVVLGFVAVAELAVELEIGVAVAGVGQHVVGAVPGDREPLGLHGG